MNSDQLKTAQNSVKLLKALSALVGLLAIAFFGLAVYLAKGWRRRAIMGSALAVIVAAVLVLVARRIVGNAVIDALVSTDSIQRPAVRAWFIETEILREIGIGLLVLGLIFLLGAWAAGPARAAVATRRALVGPFRHPGAVFAVYAGVVVLLLLIAPVANPSRAFGLLLLAVLGGVGLEAIRRQTLEEFGDAARNAARGAVGLARQGCAARAARAPPGTARARRVDGQRVRATEGRDPRHLRPPAPGGGAR